MAAESAAAEPGLPFLAGGGEVGRLLRGGATRATPLGEPASWPLPLRTLVGVMLTANSPMFIAWGSQRTLLYNDAYGPILGARHPAALARPFYEVWHEVRAEVGPILERAYAGEPTTMDDIELLVQRNGYAEEAHFSFFYTPVYDEDGAVAGVYCACSEITQKVFERRRLAAELKRQHQLFEAAPGFIAILQGPDHVFEFVNRAYSRLIGGREALGKPLREVLPEIERQGFPRLLDTVYATGERFLAHRMPALLQHSPGEPAEQVYLDLVYEPITDRAGRVTGIFVEGSDVTAARCAEIGLRELNETLEAKVAARTLERDTMWRLSKDLLAVLGPGGEFRAASPAWAEMLGFEPAEIVGRQVSEFLHPDDVDRMVNQVLAGATSQLDPFVNRYRHRDGSYRWIAWTGAPQAGAIYLIGRDVTAEHQTAERLDRMREKLRQAQKMEAVGQLTGGIAHDFNNLLQALRNNLELVRRRPDDAARVAQCAENGIRVIDRGAKLTAQLLTFSSAQRLELKPVAATALMASMAQLLERTLGPTISINLRLTDDAITVVADPTQLEMAIINLAINARDAMPSGGRLTFASALQQIGDDADLAPGEYLELSVEDSGAGMPPEVRDRAFEPFYTTKGLAKGTGLGLSQVYGFARQVGGRARIETAPGRGTRVSLLLRRASAPAAASSRVGKAGVGVAPTSAAVLLVDDDADVRVLLADCLRGVGYRVCEAADGRGGLAALAQQRPDVMVLDFAMPDMTGAEVARIARERHPQLPIIFATGYADTAAIHAALGPDAATLRKPFEIAELIDAIERVVAA